MNSFGSEKYSGLQVYYSEKNDDSKLLADVIQNKVISDIQKDNNRVTKPGKDIYVLENIENTAVLIECGFLTNKAECEKLSQKEYQKELSFSIVCAIIEYIEMSNQQN
jgi:N-acetylmuramoyl-L-alanine amidase